MQSRNFFYDFTASPRVLSPDLHSGVLLFTFKCWGPRTILTFVAVLREFVCVMSSRCLRYFCCLLKSMCRFWTWWKGNSKVSAFVLAPVCRWTCWARSWVRSWLLLLTPFPSKKTVMLWALCSSLASQAASLLVLISSKVLASTV